MYLSCQGGVWKREINNFCKTRTCSRLHIVEEEKNQCHNVSNFYKWGEGGVTDIAAHRRINFTEGKSNMVYGPDIISFPQTHL